MHNHPLPVYPCPLCGFHFNSVADLHQHIATHEPNTDYILQDGLDGAVSVYTRNYLPATPSLDLTVGQDFEALFNILNYQAVLKKYAKVNFCVTAEFVRVGVEGVERSITIFLRSRTFILTPHIDIYYFIKRSYAEIVVNLEDVITGGSDWNLGAIYCCQVNIASCSPLSGACGTISTAHMRHGRNIVKGEKSNDRACFFRAVARHFVKTDDVEELELFICQHFDMTGFELPFKIDQL